MVIDHLGISQSPVSPARAEPWDRLPGLLGLAKYPNVSVKLSGAPNYSKEPYPYRDINSHIKLLFDAFGPRRCFWGTDLTAGIDRFPNFTYQQRITHFTEELPFLSEDDKERIWYRNAGEIFGLEPPAVAAE